METNQTEQAAVSPYAAGLNWSADLQTGDDRMDHTHEEFVTMLNALLLTPQASEIASQNSEGLSALMLMPGTSRRTPLYRV